MYGARRRANLSPYLPNGPENLPALVYVKFECVSAGHVPHARWCGNTMLFMLFKLA